MEQRLATINDIPDIMEIIDEAKQFLKASGVDQWQDGYPNAEVFTDDIMKGECHVFFDGEKLAGMISVCFQPDECYNYVEGGKWLTGDMPYAVFHRTAVKHEYRGKRVSIELLSFAADLARENGCSSLRGDTHRDNEPMGKLLSKAGFARCGTIYLGGERSTKNARVCYEKLL